MIVTDRIRQIKKNFIEIIRIKHSKISIKGSGIVVAWGQPISKVTIKFGNTEEKLLIIKHFNLDLFI